MASQPKMRARRGAQHLPKHKRNPSVPRELAVFLCLPECVGSLLDYEWSEPVGLKEPVATLVVSKRPGLDPRELDRLCSNPAALRKFLAEKQRQIDAFKPKRPTAFQEIRGALSGGAL